MDFKERLMAKSSTDAAGAQPKGDGGGKNWLALLRIFVGAYFIHSSLDKFTASYIGEFTRMVGRWSHDSSFEIYRNFVSHYVAPHAKFFAYFTAIGEFYVGITLVIGFLSGLAALVGIFFYINYFLGGSEGNALWTVAHVTISLLVIFFTKAGRNWGLDKYLSKKILFKHLV